MKPDSVSRIAWVVLLAFGPGVAETRGEPNRSGGGFRPVIAVEAVYPGASPETVAEAVAAPIEREVNGTPGLITTVSRCTDDGRYVLWLSFLRGSDLDMTQVLVQNRVSLALPQLPEAVQKEGVKVRKVSAGASLVVMLTSSNSLHDGRELTRYASLYVKDFLARIPGVGAVNLDGEPDIWTNWVQVRLEPDRLRAHGLTGDDVLKALRGQEAFEVRALPVGRIQGLQRGRTGFPRFEGVADAVVKQSPDGVRVRVRDVGRVGIGPTPYRVGATFNGSPAAALEVFLTLDANPRDVSAFIREWMGRLKEDFPPGVDWQMPVDLTAGTFGRAARPWCLLAELGSEPLTTPERTDLLLNQCGGALRRVDGVKHVQVLPENPWGLFRGGPCVVAVFDRDLEAGQWEKARRAARAALADVPDVAVRVRELAGPSGPRRDGYPIDFAVRGLDARAVRQFGEAVADRLTATGRLTDLAVGPALTTRRPEVEIDLGRAAALDVPVRAVLDSLQLVPGVADDRPPGRSRQVLSLPVPAARRTEDLMKDLTSLFVRSTAGKMVPLSPLVRVKEAVAAESVVRVDLLPALMLSANPAEGVSPAEARWLCEAVTEQVRKDLRLSARYALVWMQEVPAPKPVPEALKATAAPAPPKVAVAVPVAREVTDSEEFVGRVEASQRAELRARVTGYLEKVQFKDEAEVKKGDVLFVIDPRPYRAALDQARAAVQAAEAQRELGKKNLDRLRALGAATPRSELETAEATERVAAAQLDVAKAAHAVAGLNLDFATVRAPFAGRIGRSLVDPGNLVRGDETVLAELVNVEPARVSFDVDERTALRLARQNREGDGKGQRDARAAVRIGLSDDADFPLSGTCDLTDGQVDPAKGTVVMRAVVPNKDGLLRPGLFARVRLDVGPPHRALLVPEGVIVTVDGQASVLVVDDKGTAAARAVEVGRRHGGLAEILKGLDAKDRVIGAPARVRPGQTVAPVPAPR